MLSSSIPRKKSPPNNPLGSSVTQDEARDSPGDKEHQQKVAEQRHADPEDTHNAHLRKAYSWSYDFGFCR